MKHVICLLLIFTACLSCKKAGLPTKISKTYKKHLAPCTQEYTAYDYDSVFYSPSPDFPNANYRIKFGYTNGVYFEFGFEQKPVTGTYYQVKNINPSLDINQVAYKEYRGAYGLASTDYVVETIYIDANSDQVIISSCNLDLIMVDPQTWEPTFYSQVTESIQVKKEF